MKIMLLAALVLLPVWALADSAARSPNEELQAMTQKLNLSPEQQGKIKPLLVAEANQKKSIEENKTLTPLQKQLQLEMVHRAILQQVQAQLTPAQKVQEEQGTAAGAAPTHP